MVINEYKYLILLHLIVVNRSETPLHNAVQNKNQLIAEFLVQLGANIDHQTIEKETPYTIAQKYQHNEIIEYFDKLKKWIPGISNI